MSDLKEYLKKNGHFSLEEEMNDLMVKIDHKHGEIYDLKEAKTLTLNDVNEYSKLVMEAVRKTGDNNITAYDSFLGTHGINFHILKEELAMTTNDINSLNELMKDKDPYIRNQIADNPNATQEMLRELSKEYGNTMAIIENPNTPIDLLEKYSLDHKDTGVYERSVEEIEVYERANEKLQERQQNNINVIENFLQDLNKENMMSSWGNVDINNTEPTSDFIDRKNQVIEILRELPSDIKGTYINKVTNALTEFNNELSTKKEPEHTYDFER